MIQMKKNKQREKKLKETKKRKKTVQKLLKK